MKNGSSTATATDELVSVPVAAALLGLSRRAAYYLVSSGEIPSVQYPSRTAGKAGAIRIRRSEIEKFLKRSERAAAP